MWSIEAYWTGMVPEAKMIRVILRLFIILRVILRTFCCGDLSHVLYSSKDPCCSLACGHRRISSRRFSSPKWVERSDDRKYVCVRRLAVPKRHNFCSRTSISLATSSTCNHSFLSRLVDSIQSAPRASLHFQILLSSLFKSWYFSNFSSEILAYDGKCEICQACMFASPPSNLFEPYKQRHPTTVSSLMHCLGYPEYFKIEK